MSHDPQTLWDTLRKGLAQRLPERTFSDWIEPCHAINFDGTTLLIQVPSPSARIWIEQQLAEEFHDVLVQSDLASLRLAFMVAGDAKPAKAAAKPKAATQAVVETPLDSPFPQGFHRYTVVQQQLTVAQKYLTAFQHGADPPLEAARPEMRHVRKNAGSRRGAGARKGAARGRHGAGGLEEVGGVARRRDAGSQHALVAGLLAVPQRRRECEPGERGQPGQRGDETQGLGHRDVEPPDVGALVQEDGLEPLRRPARRASREDDPRPRRARDVGYLRGGRQEDGGLAHP